MENQWIPEKLVKLKRLHSECGEQEIALSRYISCMIRMLNELAQMEYSEFHFYEKLILWDSLKIFTEHFIEQIEIAKCELDVREKRELIDDIEDAVDRMTSVYKNVIDSTANSDRQMLSSIPIDTSIYELSPKICAFYSLILNKLVEMFEEDSGKYAFVLHPTLKNNTETKIMFERRKKSGKVVIIYISESIIEMFDVVSVFIVHEAFHVLTKKERMRKSRIKSFIELMLAGMKQLLFENIIFNNQEKENEKIVEELLKLFFFDCQEEALIWANKEEDSREFYSGNVKEWGNRYFRNCLKNKPLEKLIRELIAEGVVEKSYKQFKSNCEKEEQIIGQLQSNVSNVLYENKTMSLAKQFVFIQREVYADIACILTLQLSSDEYQKAFEKSKQFRSDEKYYDSTRMLRNYIVALSVANHLPKSINETWKNYADELDKILKGNTGAKFANEKDSTFSSTYVMLYITPQMHQALLGYAQVCAQAFSNRVESVNEIQSFRKRMSDIRNCNSINLLKEIMLGNFSEII